MHQNKYQADPSRPALNMLHIVGSLRASITMITLNHYQLVDSPDHNRFQENDLVIDSTENRIDVQSGVADGDRESQKSPFREMIDKGVLLVNFSDHPDTPMRDPLTFAEKMATRAINGAQTVKFEDEIGSRKRARV